MIRLSDGRFAQGEMWDPVEGHVLCGPLIRLGETTEENGIVSTLSRGGWGRWRWCKYCAPPRYVTPYDLHEAWEHGESRICVCSQCGAGLDLLRTDEN